MWLHSLLASWKSGRSRSRRPQSRPARRGTRLFVEQLEDRMLPSAYTAGSVLDLINDITAANMAGGTNTINLMAPTTSPYALTTFNTFTGYSGNGLPVIAANDNLTIVGNGDTIERAETATAPFRLLNVAPLASLTLQNLTLQGGLVGGITTGGAIYNQGALTLSGVTVANNKAVVEFAGGGGGGGIWSNGSLTLENGTVLQGNFASSAIAPEAACGGAVYVAGGTANISSTTLTWNAAEGPGTGGGGGFGGALYVAAGQVILTNSTVNFNFASSGLGLGFGGGLCVTGGTVALANDTVESNTAYYGGGGLYISGGTVTLANDTVESNTAYYGGGGLFVADGTVTLANDTVESNEALVYSGFGISGFGGGAYLAGGTVILTNTTLSGNSASTSGGGILIASRAPGYLDAFTIANTLNNTDNTGLNGSTANIDGPYIETPAAGQPPIVARAASASASPVTGTTTSLSVLGIDAAGASSLTYTWAVTSAPAGAATPTFSSNGSNASENTTATFYRAGTYIFQVTLTDPSNLTVASSVTVIVNQTVTSVSVTPGTVALAVKSKQQFQAAALDQFGQLLAAQPSSFTWSIAAGGIGSINSNGAYTAPNSGTGSATIQATISSITGTATVTIKAFPPVITAPASAKQTTVTGTQTQLQVQASDPQGASLSYAWSVTGAPAPTFSNPSSNNTTVTFHEAGSYTFTVTVTDALGLVSTSSVTVTVAQTLSNLSLTPATVTLADGATEQFTATALDQFGMAMASQPTFTWQVNGGGAIGKTGFYTAPASGTGNFKVTVSADGKNAQADITVDL